jgi:glyoxylase-like metal-dependent hydrolase (beta-lactamase superfamily II)
VATVVPVAARSGSEVWLVRDGTGGLPPDALFATAGPAERAAAVREPLDELGRVPASYDCLLVRSAGTTLLVDGGLGDVVHPLGSDAGHLLAALARLDVEPEDVDVVLVTHAHLDHVGGLVRDGRPVFGRATHLVPRAERLFWQSNSELQASAPVSVRVARAAFAALGAAGLLEDLEPGERVVDGVVALPAPGHTPGQVAVRIGDVLHLADAIVHPLHVEHPTWALHADTSPADVAATRRALCELAVRERLVVTASHVWGPGRIDAAADGYRFRPVPARASGGAG